MEETIAKEKATGKVVRAYGNLLHVEFQGNIRQGEVLAVQLKELSLSAEVIEIVGQEAKVQVFEDTRGIALDTPVIFLGKLMEAELGPGLLTSIFDGLQNPLEKVAEKAGLFLSRGISLPPLDRKKKWDFLPISKVGDILERGDSLGEVKEQFFSHKIMVPFSLRGKMRITWMASGGAYSIEEVIAKVQDDEGKEFSICMLQRWPVKIPLKEGKKIKSEQMMSTGLRIIDTQFPVLKGGTFCTPGPFGAGKTVLQHHLSKFSEVDIVIIAACGERAGEVVEVLREFPHLIDTRKNVPLIHRTVIICNTSSMPVSAREASVYMAVTIGEYYRQMGLDVLVLADSTSRWAQAMREMSGRLEEIPGEEAFPAYLASRIAAFYERSGVLLLKDQREGSLTIGGSVSPAGGNFEEPVTQATLAVTGAFLGLSRERSDARRYPAIDPLISWTKYLSRVGALIEKKSSGWTKKVAFAWNLLKQGKEIEKRMEVVGEEGIPMSDMVVYLKSELYDSAYLQQNAFDKEDQFCPLERQLELFRLMDEIFQHSFVFDTNDEARSYFLSLQNEIRNMNFLAFHSSEYEKTLLSLREKIRKRKER
jgi:V/A-type H+/Na+-transporting ATPase subunit A